MLAKVQDVKALITRGGFNQRLNVHRLQCFNFFTRCVKRETDSFAKEKKNGKRSLHFNMLQRQLNKKKATGFGYHHDFNVYRLRVIFRNLRNA